MRANSSLTPSQREAAIAWFEQGRSDQSVATTLGVSRWPIRRLYQRWRIHGPGALVAKQADKSYSFEFKIQAVRRIPAGEENLEVRDRSRDVWWLATPSFGESRHNLHHADPTCARHGVLKGQIDISARLIWIFEKLGWASKVRWPNNERLKAKMVNPRQEGVRPYTPRRVLRAAALDVLRRLGRPRTPVVA